MPGKYLFVCLFVCVNSFETKNLVHNRNFILDLIQMLWEYIYWDRRLGS